MVCLLNFSLLICYCSLCTDVTAIIFVVACSSFNMVIREDESTVSIKANYKQVQYLPCVGVCMCVCSMYMYLLVWLLYSFKWMP